MPHMGVSDEDDHDKLVFVLGESAPRPWTLDSLQHPSGAQPLVELAPSDEGPLRDDAVLPLCILPATTPGLAIPNRQPTADGLFRTSMAPSALSSPASKRKVCTGRSSTSFGAAPSVRKVPHTSGGSTGVAQVAHAQTPHATPTHAQKRFPTKLVDLQTPLAQRQLRGLPFAAAPVSVRAACDVNSTSSDAQPPGGPPGTPAQDRKPSMELLGIPTAPRGKALTCPKQKAKHDKMPLLKTPQRTSPTVAGLFQGCSTPAPPNKPSIPPAPSSSRAQQPMPVVQTPALVHPAASQQHKTPMTMAHLGLPTHTIPAQQMPTLCTSSKKPASRPLLVSPGFCLPAGKASKIVQEGTSSLFAPKVKKHKGKISSLVQRLEDAQACLAQAQVEAMELSAAGLQQVPHLQFSIGCAPILDGESVKVLCRIVGCPGPQTSRPDTQSLKQKPQLQDDANAEVLQEASRAYVILDRDQSSEWWKETRVGDSFVVLQPWSVLPAQYNEVPVILAFVAVPLPNE